MKEKTQKVQKRSTAHRKALWFVLIGLFPGVFCFCFLNIRTIFNSILMSFETPSQNGIYYSFYQFSMVVKQLKMPDSKIFESLINTLKFFVFDLVLMTAICISSSYFIYKKIYMYKFFRFAFFLPSILPSVVLVAVFKELIGANGPVLPILEVLMGESPVLLKDSRYALDTIMFYQLWTGLGYSVILFTASFSRIPPSIIEYGKLEGVKPWQELVHILIPLIWPMLSVILLNKFIGVFGASGPILLFTNGDAKTYTLAFYIYAYTAGVGGAGVNLPLASAVGLFFTLIGLPIAIIFYKLANKVEAVEY